MKNRILSGLSLLVACVLLIRPTPAQAGGGGGGGGPCAGFSAGDTLVMRDNCFDGVAHFVERGARLTVQNKGEYPHSFTAVDGSFDTGVLSSGETAEIQLGQDGIVKVVCTLHGTVALIGGGGLLGVVAFAAVRYRRGLGSGGEGTGAGISPVDS